MKLLCCFFLHREFSIWTIKSGNTLNSQQRFNQFHLEPSERHRGMRRGSTVAGEKVDWVEEKNIHTLEKLKASQSWLSNSVGLARSAALNNDFNLDILCLFACWFFSCEIFLSLSLECYSTATASEKLHISLHSSGSSSRSWSVSASTSPPFRFFSLTATPRGSILNILCVWGGRLASISMTLHHSLAPAARRRRRRERARWKNMGMWMMWMMMKRKNENLTIIEVARLKFLTKCPCWSSKNHSHISRFAPYHIIIWGKKCI